MFSSSLPRLAFASLTTFALFTNPTLAKDAPPPVTSTPLDPINFGAFAHTAFLSVAEELGFFAHYGLNVTFMQIPNSTFAYPNLIDGGYDALSGPIDNPISFRFNQNFTLTVLGQLDAGPDLVIASRPNITSVQQLRGQVLSVDSPTSGYAWVLEKILSLYGLHLANGDYSFEVIGSTPLRYDALIGNSTPGVATILTYPFVSLITTLPEDQQPLVLARVSDYVQPYTGSVLTISTPNIADPKLLRLTAAFIASIRFLQDPANKACAISAIAADLNVTTEVATLEYAAATSNLTGVTTAIDLEVDRQGVLNVIDVRSQGGGFAALNAAFPDFSLADAIVPGTGQLIDLSVRDAALSLVDDFFPAACGKADEKGGKGGDDDGKDGDGGKD